MLKLTPRAFLDMSINEFKLAQEGYLESKGIRVNNMKWSDVEEIMKKHNISKTSYSIKRK